MVPLKAGLRPLTRAAPSARSMNGAPERPRADDGGSDLPPRSAAKGAAVRRPYQPLDAQRDIGTSAPCAKQARRSAVQMLTLTSFTLPPGWMSASLALLLVRSTCLVLRHCAVRRGIPSMLDCAAPLRSPTSRMP